MARKRKKTTLPEGLPETLPEGPACPPQPVYLRRGYFSRVPDIDSLVWQMAQRAEVDLTVLQATTIFVGRVPKNQIFLVNRVVLRAFAADQAGYLGGHAWTRMDNAAMEAIGRYVVYYGRKVLFPFTIGFPDAPVNGWRITNENILDVGEIGCVAVWYKQPITVDFILEQNVGGTAWLGAEIGGRLVSVPTYQALVKDARI